jgi:hypothetical protein
MGDSLGLLAVEALEQRRAAGVGLLGRTLHRLGDAWDSGKRKHRWGSLFLG